MPTRTPTLVSLPAEPTDRAAPLPEAPDLLAWALVPWRVRFPYTPPDPAAPHAAMWVALSLYLHAPQLLARTLAPLPIAWSSLDDSWYVNDAPLPEATVSELAIDATALAVDVARERLAVTGPLPGADLGIRAIIDIRRCIRAATDWRLGLSTSDRADLGRSILDGLRPHLRADDDPDPPAAPAIAWADAWITEQGFRPGDRLDPARLRAAYVLAGTPGDLTRAAGPRSVTVAGSLVHALAEAGRIVPSTIRGRRALRVAEL